VSDSTELIAKAELAEGQLFVQLFESKFRSKFHCATKPPLIKMVFLIDKVIIVKIFMYCTIDKGQK